eukprot:TRINITY_DN6305_c0_g1_i2.p1 TRINITY_DN6305_c0_g1~~TRINITY_DN6305_c0_g1_i2.p1  ORF type:complete len:120 (-),score=8.44 TRINITY_DN6305_c0_g1_i2:139-498(-)
MYRTSQLLCGLSPRLCSRSSPLFTLQRLASSSYSSKSLRTTTSTSNLSTSVSSHSFPPFNTLYSRFSSSTMPVKIGTHNGHFHCDEALACAMLKLLPEYKDASITRTRDPAVLDEQGMY